jgi:CubicO group peptidase (beta-lactamase class C family)
LKVTQNQNASGSVAPGFERVRAAFEANFRLRDELGAAFAVYRDGEPVVDLWGGAAERATGRPWQEGSLQLIFSGTKGLVATCVLILLDRGVLALDDPVAAHWPEFAAAGKSDVRVRDLVAHTARLPAVQQEVSVDEILDDRRMAALLAAQPQSDDPRAAGCYHPLTFGWLVGELVRRADGRSVGRFFADEVAVPLGLELWIGLPGERASRVTTIEPSPAARPEELDPLARKIRANPPIWEPEVFGFNRRDLHACEMPAVNGIGTARSLARLYGCLAAGGVLDGVRIVSADAIDLGRRPLSVRREPLIDVDVAFGVGFRLPTSAGEYGPVAGAFGHTGAGGSVHGAWPEHGIGFSYALNRMSSAPDDVRAAALLDALAKSIER